MRNDYRDERYRRKERKLRRMYRGRIFIVFVLALILGVLLGWIACVKIVDRSDRTSANALAITAEPSADVTPEATWSDPFFQDGDETEDNLFGEFTSEPSVEPESTEPSAAEFELTGKPTAEPTAEPTLEPAEPTAEPTLEPAEPAAGPTEEQDEEPAEKLEDESTAEPVDEQTQEPTIEPVDEQTQEPTVEPDAGIDEPMAGDAQLPVAMNEEYTFTMQVLADGTPRIDADEAEYYELPVTISLTRHMDSAYYAENYSTSYQLKGDEACCELKVKLGDCDGINSVSLQAALPMVLVDAEGNIIPGYQFRNAEIGGETDSNIAVGSSATIYKRYSENPQVVPVNLMATYYMDGKMNEVYFSLSEPEPAETPVPEPVDGESDGATPAPETTPEPANESYTIGSAGESVRQLQNKLIQLGYLSGVADGKFGKWTAAAVEQAQKDFGLEATGVADATFLDVLYTK